MMGRRGGGSRGRLKFAACERSSRSRFRHARAGLLRPCTTSPPRRPPPAHAVRAQFRIGQATATADLDSDHILVREFADAGHARWRCSGLSRCLRFSARGSRRASRTPGSRVGSTVRRRMRITRSISTFAPSSSTSRRKKSMSTSPPGSSRLAAGRSWRTRFSLFGPRSSQPTLPMWRRRWIRRLRPS